MEEYLRNMKSLRSQMNDFEEDSANRSVEEQMQKTTINALEKDLQLVRSETKRLQEETKEMVKAKGEVCSQIVEKQKKVSSMETESFTLSQTLELLKQELVSTSVKVEEKRSYYAKVMEDLSAKLQDQQDWFNSNMRKMTTDTTSVEGSPNKQMSYIRGKRSGAMLSIEANLENMGDETSGRYKDLMTQLESAETKLQELMAKKSEISLESSKRKQLIEQLVCTIEDLPPELKEMDVETLEKEHTALLADKAGETEYMQSLQERITQMKAISHVVNCQCGEEYKVELKG